MAQQTRYPNIRRAVEVVEDEGFTYDGSKVYEWTSKDGLVSATIRSSKQGWYIEYVA